MPPVLIADDPAFQRTIPCSSLGENGYKAEEAKNCLEGLGAIKAQKPEIIITDLLAPSI